MFGVCQFLGQFPIIGKQQDSGSIAVKPAHRINAFACGIPDELKNGFTALRVFVGGDLVFWFVQ
jgi:hypothetical protein